MQPDEAIDLPEALAAYTIGAAYAMGLENAISRAISFGEWLERAAASGSLD